MPPRHASRLRALIAALGIMTCTLAGAGADRMANLTPLGEPAVHSTPRGDTPHDSFAASTERRPNAAPSGPSCIV
jgi:hypothetical protein